MKIRNYIWVALVVGLTGIPSAAQGLSASQRAAAVDTSIGSTCSERAPKVPRVNAHDAKVFSSDRIERTLNGVWHGRVRGEYDKKFLDKEGFVNVDYYMIIDAKRGEALVFEQFGPKRSAPRPKAGTPTWSYVFCNRANYKPRHPPQVHSFYKVSDNVEDARAILRASTGLALAADKGELVLADVWQQLVDTKYFDDPARSLAFAGGFFKPFTIGNVQVPGGSLFSMDMRAEYRGSGMTAARFQRGVPLHGYERGKFLGIGTNSGDYLVSSIALGQEMTTDKATQEDGVISLTYDKIVIGPLAPNTPAETSNASSVPPGTPGKSSTPRK